MDPELKAYLEGFKTEFEGLRSNFQDLKSNFQDLKLDFDGKLESMERRLKEHTEIVETRLLSEFWKWGRVTDQRLRRLDVGEATTVDRLATIEERVFALERRMAGGK